MMNKTCVMIVATVLLGGLAIAGENDCATNNDIKIAKFNRCLAMLDKGYQYVTKSKQEMLAKVKEKINGEDLNIRALLDLYGKCITEINRIDEIIYQVIERGMDIADTIAQEKAKKEKTPVILEFFNPPLGKELASEPEYD